MCFSVSIVKSQKYGRKAVRKGATLYGFYDADNGQA